MMAVARILRKLWNESHAARARLTPEKVLSPAERAFLREVTWAVGGTAIGVAMLGVLLGASAR